MNAPSPLDPAAAPSPPLLDRIVEHANRLLHEMRRRRMERVPVAVGAVFSTVKALGVPLGREVAFWTTFVVALALLEWFFDWEDGRIRRTERGGVPAVRRAWVRDWLLTGLVSVLLFAAGLAAYSSLNFLSRSTSIRVLTVSAPGVNTDADTFGFTFGLTEAVAQSTRLRVMPFLGDSVETAFSVRSTVEAGDGGLHLHAWLVDNRTGLEEPLGSFSVGASPFDPASRQAQLGVTRALANRLHYGLSFPTWMLRYDRAPGARRAWLASQGRRRLQHWSYGSVDVGRGLFQQAAKDDSTSAEAHGGAAYASALLAVLGFTPKAHYKDAESSAARARALDRGATDALLAEGIVALHRRLNLPAARFAFREAVLRDTARSAAHYWYGRYLMAAGEFDGAQTAFETAARLDPQALPPMVALGEVAYYAGRYADAEAQLEAVTFRHDCRFGDEPRFPLPSAHTYLARSLLARGRPTDALEVVELTLSRCKGAPRGDSGASAAPVLKGEPASGEADCRLRDRTLEVVRAQALKAAGRRMEADSLVACVEQMHRWNAPAYELAIYHASGPDPDSARAADWLGRALRAHLQDSDASRATFWRVDPYLRGIRPPPSPGTPIVDKILQRI